MISFRGDVCRQRKCTVSKNSFTARTFHKHSRNENRRHKDSKNGFESRREDDEWKLISIEEEIVSIREYISVLLTVWSIYELQREWKTCNCVVEATTSSYIQFESHSSDAMTHPWQSSYVQLSNFCITSKWLDQKTRSTTTAPLTHPWNRYIISSHRSLRMMTKGKKWWIYMFTVRCQCHNFDGEEFSCVFSISCGETDFHSLIIYA